MSFEEQKLNNAENEEVLEIPVSNLEGSLVENEPNAEFVAAEKTTDIESSATELIADGEQEVDRLVEQFDPPAEVAGKYQRLLDSISEKGRGFASEAVNRIKQAAVGASMLAATSGFAEAQMPNPNVDMAKDPQKIEQIQKEKEKKDHVKEIGEKVKVDLLMQMSSEAYAEKMKKEYESYGVFSRIMASYQIYTRKKNIEKTEIVPSKEDDIKMILKNQLDAKLKSALEKIPKNEELKRNSLEANVGASKEFSDERHIGGYCDSESYKVYLAYDNDEESDVNIASNAQHELSHSGTDLGLKIPKRTEELLRDSFEVANNEGIAESAYLSASDEMLARKKQLDMDLESLGIKKYGEPTTEKHIEEMMDSYIKGDLSRGSMELIDHLKDGNLKRVLDEIAKNENDDAAFAG